MMGQLITAVVVGYDRQARTITLHSGTTPRLVLPLASVLTIMGNSTAHSTRHGLRTFARATRGAKGGGG